jgi:ActR/RegA family two-component response regulator
MHVLIVDAYEPFANALARWLRSQGIGTITAVKTRSAALDVIRKRSVSVVVVDFHLGSEDPTGGDLLLEQLDNTDNDALRILLTAQESVDVHAVATRRHAVGLHKTDPLERLGSLLSPPTAPRVDTRS